MSEVWQGWYTSIQLSFIALHLWDAFRTFKTLNSQIITPTPHLRNDPHTHGRAHTSGRRRADRCGEGRQKSRNRFLSIVRTWRLQLYHPAPPTHPPTTTNVRSTRQAFVILELQCYPTLHSVCVCLCVKCEVFDAQAFAAAAAACVCHSTSTPQADSGVPALAVCCCTPSPLIHHLPLPLALNQCDVSQFRTP